MIPAISYLVHLDHHASAVKMVEKLNVFVQKNVSIMEILLALDRCVEAMEEIIQMSVK